MFSRCEIKFHRGKIATELSFVNGVTVDRE